MTMKVYANLVGSLLLLTLPVPATEHESYPFYLGSTFGSGL